jgi:hypothetical protein
MAFRRSFVGANPQLVEPRGKNEKSTEDLSIGRKLVRRSYKSDRNKV